MKHGASVILSKWHWKKVHDQFFENEYKQFGKTFYEQAPMMCEVFEKIY